MQTIGEYFRSERAKKSLTLSDVQDLTKIKKEFLQAIEKEDWKKLPEYPVLFGFIKNIARALEIPQDKAVAIFRRDYPPAPVAVAPKKEKKEFRWSPKLTFLLGVSAVILVIALYLGNQFLAFSRPPKLEIFEPTHEQVVRKTSIKVIGKTNNDATVRVNNQPVIVSDDGTFETELGIFEGTSTIEIVATSRSGKESRVSRTIKPDLNSPNE